MADTLVITDDMLNSGDYLDRLAGLDPTGEQEEIAPPVTPPATPPAAPPVTPPVEKPAEKPPEAPAETPPVVPPAEEPPPAEKTAETPPPAEKPAAKDLYPDLQLSPHAKPSTSTAFASLKERAFRDLSERDTKIEALTKELQTVKEAATPPAEPLTDDIKAELAQLRAFRESVALEGDPVFVKKYEEPLKALDESLFTQLKGLGLADESVAKIKELGVGEVDWDKIKEALGPRAKPLIDRKLMERDALIEGKSKALENARSNYDAAVKERRELSSLREQEDLGKAQTEFDGYLTKVEALKAKPIPVTASPEERAQLTAYNKSLASAIAEGRGALAHSGTPEGRAELAAIVALSRVLRTRADAAEGSARSEQTAHAATKAELAKLRTELEATKKTLSDVKAAGRATSARTQTPVRPPGGIDLRDTNSALDELARSAE